MPLATGQITVVDLTDLPSLQGYLTSTQPKIQFQGTDNVYNPSWASSPYLKIEAELYAVGSGTNIASDAKVTAITWYKNGVEITANGGGITRNASATGNLLNTSITINQNLLTVGAPTMKIDCVMMYKHAATVAATPVKVSIEYGLAKQGATGADGVAALTAILSNESCSVPVTTGGVVTYTNTRTKITVYEGSTELEHDGAGTSAGTWKVDKVGTGITPGAISDSGTSAITDIASGITADTAKIVFTITGKRANGTAFTLTKEQTITKSNQGAKGNDALAIDLSGSQVFKYDSTGGNVTPTSITVTSTRKNITGTTYTWTYGLDGAAPTTALNTTNFPGVTFGTDTATITAASTGWASAKSITIKAENSGVTDTITIYKVQDGAHSYGVALETTSHLMTFDYLGAASPANQEITLTAVLNNLSSPSFAGTWYNAAGIGTPVTAGDIVGTGNTRTFNVSKWPATAVRIKFTATAGGYSDSLTVIKVQEASSAFAGYLTNETIALACDKAGAVIGTLGTLTTGTYKTFLGTTALATGVVYSEELASRVNCTATIDSVTGIYSLLTLTGDTASTTFKATHTASGAFMLKTFSVAKSKVGADGKAAVNMEVWAPLGSVFKTIGGTAPAALTLQADLFEGPTSVSASSYAWFIQTGTASDNGAGAGWDIIDATTGCTNYTTKTLTVPASAVNSFENFKCKATYNSVAYYGVASLTDMTDPYNVVVWSSDGNTFFNGGGANKTLVAKVYQGGELVDEAGTGLAYAWSKWVNGALIGSAGTTKSITVAAADVASEATYICDINYL